MNKEDKTEIRPANGARAVELTAIRFIESDRIFPPFLRRLDEAELMIVHKTKVEIVEFLERENLIYRSRYGYNPKSEDAVLILK